jgi:hypothetical protein
MPRSHCLVCQSVMLILKYPYFRFLQFLYFCSQTTLSDHLLNADLSLSFEKYVVLREYKDTSKSGHIYVLEQSSALDIPSYNIPLSTVALILCWERMLPP